MRRERVKRWNARNPEKRRAHNVVGNEIKQGRLDRPAECARCKATGPVQASHDDYSKPLEIEWLCIPCHRRKDIWIEDEDERAV